MTTFRSLASALIILLVSASSFAQGSEPTHGIAVSGSPVSGWSLNIDHSNGPSNGFNMRGSAFEIAVLRDYGIAGDKGVIFSTKRLNDKTFVGGEFYSFMPFVGTANGLLQFGPTIGAGAGALNGGFMLSGRAEGTLAIRTGPNVKIKAGWGLDYPRLQAFRLSASYLF